MKHNLTLFTVLLVVSILSACSTKTKEKYTMKKDIFGHVDGKEIVLISLKNSAGNTLKLTNFGAAIVWIGVPDRNGKIDNITFGYDSLTGYTKGDPYFGSTVGRYANRIAKGQFTLEGVEYHLAINNPPNSLHGGPGGWHSVVWDYEIIDTVESVPTVRFTYYSPDMEEGYPGNMSVAVSYKWTEKNEVIISYECSTDKETVLNITNHAYFNLNGAGNGNILGHEITINASGFTPVDSTLIPTGEIRPVTGTPFDFTSAHTVGERIDEDYDQLILGRGYDHNFVLDNSGAVDATAYSPESGRYMEMETDQPGVQFYCGNFLDGTQTGHNGRSYEYRGGFCFETQHFPDSPNHPEFPSTVLKPGEKFRSQTIYRFSTK
jgi:aldose 1-epimerase